MSPSDSFHHQLQKLMEAESNRNNSTPSAPPPYTTNPNPPQARPRMTDIMSDIVYTDEPNPLAITIDASINVVGNNNTLALTSERTPNPKKDHALESSKPNTSSTGNAASGTYLSRKQDREAKTAKLASIILKALQQADGLTDEYGRKRTVSVLLKCGIKVEGCNNEVLSDENVNGLSPCSLRVSSRKRASSVSSTFHSKSLRTEPPIRVL